MDNLSKIWIIDDDDIFTFGAKRMFSKSNANIQVDSFHSAEEAIEKLESGNQDPELIFLDINMPIMDGWEFLDAYAELGPRNHIKIIMTSSSIDPEDLKRIEGHALIHRYLQKPISIEGIQNAINEIRGSKS